MRALLAKGMIIGLGTSWVVGAGPAFAQESAYELKLVLESPFGGPQGNPPIDLTDLDSELGVNDEGDFAFTGINASAGGSQAFVLDALGNLRIVSFSSGSSSRVFQGASINDGSPRRVAARDRVSGSPPTYLIRSWDATTTGSFVTIGKSPDHFDSVLFYSHINDAGVVAAEALVNGSVDSRLIAGGAQPPTTIFTWPGIVFLRPQISNTNWIVVRDDVNRILVFHYPDGAQQVIASAMTDTGMEPGISGEGRAVSFSANRGSGEGVFVAAPDVAAWKVFRIVGEGLDDFTDILADRVAVTSDGDPNVGMTLTTVFKAVRGGVTGLHTVSAYVYRDSNQNLILQASPEDSGPPQARWVTWVGHKIKNAAGAEREVSGMRLYDPINQSAAIGFHASFLSGQEGIVRARRPAGKVLWGPAGSANLPAKGAIIHAYWVDPQGNAHPIADGGNPTKSQVDGSYSWPPELTSFAKQAGEQRRGVRAEIEYSERFSNSEAYDRTIVNYPRWDPSNGSFPTAAMSQISELEAHLDEVPAEIHIPYPVVFQPGVSGDGKKSAEGDNNLGLRGFLTADAGASGNEEKSKRHDDASNRLAIPSFPFFGMPSEQANGPIWGYNNNPVFATAAMVMANAIKLHNYMTDRMYPELEPYLGDTTDTLPLYLLCHSYGGLISRKWIVMNSNGEMASAPGVSDPSKVIPNPVRYVSFDAVHGGTFWATQFGWSMFSEVRLNGVGLPLLPPVVRGWNYDHRLPYTLRHLLYSNDADILLPMAVISPYTSAFGIGRTQMFFLLAFIPSGHCQRFLGGWQAYSEIDSHSLQAYDSVYRSTARFLAYGVPPDQDGTNFSSVTKYSDDIGYPSCTNLDTSHVEANLGTMNLEDDVTSSAGTSSQLGIGPWEPGVLRAVGILQGAEALLDVLDQSGNPLPKSNEGSLNLGGALLIAFDVTPAAGQGEMLRLTAGPTETAVFSGSFLHLGRPDLSAQTEKERYGIGEAIRVFAQLTDTNGQALTDLSGSFTAELEGAAGGSITLADDGNGADTLAGDGTYSGQFGGVGLPGSYRLMVVFDVTSTTKGAMKRRVFDALRVCSEDAKITAFLGSALHDSDGNGLAEDLRISIRAKAFATGSYRLFADLEDPSGDSTQFGAHADVVSLPASPVFVLSVPAALIRRTGGGPYILRAPTVTDLAGDESFHVFSDISLGNFNPAQFEPLPPPALAVAEPQEGPVGGGNEVVLRGENLESIVSVRFGLRAARFSVLADDAILVTVPAGVQPAPPLPSSIGGTPGGAFTVDILVEGPDGFDLLLGGYTYQRQ